MTLRALIDPVSRGLSPRTASLLAACAGLGLLLFSRLSYAPKYLFNFDNASFAFAIQDFDPSKHQPQPPGYPLFVALLKAIDVITNDPHHAQLAAGLLGSAVALVLLWSWTRSLFGDAPAWIAAGLMLVHPVFWLAGVANPVRVYLAVIQSATMIAAWKAMTAPNAARAFYVMSAVLGFGAGFRPEALVLLLPLWIAVGAYRKLGVKQYVTGGLVLAAASALWLGPMAFRMGGLAAMHRVFTEYLRFNSADFTVAYGASPERGLDTMYRALIWTFGMCVVWIWALPFAWPRFRASWSAPKVLAVTAALLPPVIFHAFVHVRDVDQTLISIPVVCAVGGLTLSSLPRRAAVIIAAALALVASGWSFRKPFYVEMGAASAGGIRYLDHWTQSTMEALRQVRDRPDTVLVWHSIVVPWRNVSYYFPELPILVTNGARPSWANRPLWPRIVRDPDGAIPLPIGKHVILGLSHEDAGLAVRQFGNARRIGPLIELNLAGQERIDVGTLHLRLTQLTK